MTNEVDIELAMAQKALAAAQQRKADAEAASRLAAQAALAKNLADEQERLARLKAEAEEIQRKHIEKRAKQEEEIRQAEAAKAAETRRLEAEFEERQEAARVEAARIERIRKISEAAHQAELDAANLEAALKQAAVIKVEPTPPTLATNPLGAILGRSTQRSVQIEEIGSEQQSKIQAEKDRVANDESQPARKSRPSVDQSASRDLETLLRPVLGYVNSQRCDEFSSRWSYDYLMNCAKQTVELAKAQPMGHDQFFSFLESAMEGVGG